MDGEREARWRAWMTSAQAGDSATYEKLLRELLPYVRRFVRRRLFDPSATEDVVQDVLVSLHRARHTWRPERPFGPWLRAIARNAAVDHARACARRAGRECALDGDGVPDTAAREPDPGLSPELEAALSALPDSQREAVTLIHVEGLSVAEAAKRAGVSGSALKVRAHRGYRALRAALDQEAGE